MKEEIYSKIAVEICLVRLYIVLIYNEYLKVETGYDLMKNRSKVHSSKVLEKSIDYNILSVPIIMKNDVCVIK